MAIFDWLKTRKALTLDEVRRAEIKLGIKENQTLGKLEKLEKEREEIFARGAKIKSPAHRRQMARIYDTKSQGVRILERELAMTSKELTTLSAVKLALERQKNAKEGISKLLHRVDEAELMTLLEDDKVTQEMYAEKLTSVLSAVTEGSSPLPENLGREGNEVMDIWQKMDEGEIESFDDALKLADQEVREKTREAEVEPE